MNDNILYMNGDIVKKTYTFDDDAKIAIHVQI